MMPNDSNTSKGCTGSVKWLVGAGFTLLGVCASIVGILEFFEPPAAPYVPAAGQVVVVSVTSEPAAEQVDASLEEWQIIESFLRRAVDSEIAAYQYGDPAYAAMFYGDALQTIQSQIEDLNSNGIFLAARFDHDNSYIHDIRFTQNNRIEVDSCEYWAHDYYDRQTGALLSSDSWKLVPQTIMIEYLNAAYFITSVAFYTGQAFCY
jgi:hypothetical protein